MKVAALLQFLDSLANALAAAGDGSASRDLTAATGALSRFHSLEVSDFAAFLQRAQTYRESGAVAVPSPGDRQTDALVQALRELNGAIEKNPDSIADRQQQAAQALSALAQKIGVKGKLTTEPKWAAQQAAKARVTPQVSAVRALAGRITSPESYQDSAITTEFDRLIGQLDRDTLKGVADELGVRVTAAMKADKALLEMLGKLSGQVPPKPAKASKGADPVLVEEHAGRLKVLVERSANPDALTEAEVETQLSKLQSLKKPVLFEIVTKSGIEGARAGDSASALLDRVRNRLLAARRSRERAGA